MRAGLLIFALLFWTAQVKAETFQWIDDNGTIHFTDDAQKIPRKQRKNIRTETDVPGKASKASKVSKYENKQSVIENVSYENYEVSGATELELRQQMNNNGIRWKDGKTHDAFTSWQTRWNGEYGSSQGKCYIKSVKVYLDVIFRLPQWVNNSRAPLELKDKWSKYIHKLQNHENGHKLNGVNAANDLAKGLSSLKHFDTCEEADQAAKVLVNQITKIHEHSDEKYDAQTGYGTTQGAVFP